MARIIQIGKPAPPRFRLWPVTRYVATFLAGMLLGLVLGGCTRGAAPWNQAKLPAATHDLSPHDVYSRVDAAFVMVMTEGPTGNTGQGSGTVIDNLAGHQLVLTAAHLFHADKKEAIVLVDRGDGSGEGFPARLVAKDDGLDLALVEVLGHLNRQVLPVSSVEPRLYDPVFLEGNPSSAPSTVGPGVLSALRRPLRKALTYQITGFCWPGASGGPVANARGELVGVIRAVLSVEDDTVEDPKRVLVPYVCYAAPLVSVRAFLKKVGVIL